MVTPLSCSALRALYLIGATNPHSASLKYTKNDCGFPLHNLLIFLPLMRDSCSSSSLQNPKQNGRQHAWLLLAEGLYTVETP